MDKTKSLVITLLVLCLVLEQHSQVVHAANSCCPSSTARNMYNACRFRGASRETCARFARCEIVQGRCKDPHCLDQSRPYSHSEVVANAVLEFCQSGCTSSVCHNDIKTAVLIKEDANNDAVDRCGEACYRFCTKHVDTATKVSSA